MKRILTRLFGITWVNGAVAPRRDSVVGTVLFGNCFGVKRIERQTFGSMAGAERWVKSHIETIEL